MTLHAIMFSRNSTCHRCLELDKLAQLLACRDNFDQNSLPIRIPPRTIAVRRPAGPDRPPVKLEVHDVIRSGPAPRLPARGAVCGPACFSVASGNPCLSHQRPAAGSVGGPVTVSPAPASSADGARRRRSACAARGPGRSVGRGPAPPRSTGSRAGRCRTETLAADLALPPKHHRAGGLPSTGGYLIRSFQVFLYGDKFAAGPRTAARRPTEHRSRWPNRRGRNLTRGRRGRAAPCTKRCAGLVPPPPARRTGWRWGRRGARGGGPSLSTEASLR